MKITVIVVGKLKSQFKEIDDFYQKRISKYQNKSVNLQLELKNVTSCLIPAKSV